MLYLIIISYKLTTKCQATYKNTNNTLYITIGSIQALKFILGVWGWAERTFYAKLMKKIESKRERKNKTKRKKESYHRGGQRLVCRAGSIPLCRAVDGHYRRYSYGRGAQVRRSARTSAFRQGNVGGGYHD